MICDRICFGTIQIKDAPLYPLFKIEWNTKTKHNIIPCFIWVWYWDILVIFGHLVYKKVFSEWKRGNNKWTVRVHLPEYKQLFLLSCILSSLGLRKPTWYFNFILQSLSERCKLYDNIIILLKINDFILFIVPSILRYPKSIYCNSLYNSSNAETVVSPWRIEKLFQWKNPNTKEKLWNATYCLYFSTEKCSYDYYCNYFTGKHTFIIK